MQTRRFGQGDAEYPPPLLDRLGGTAPRCLYAAGDAGILEGRFLGLVCSVQCPGSVVLRTFDAARALRDAGVPVAGGFHSPMERECLDILLRGEQPVLLCAARGIKGLRIGQAARRAANEGRLLILSPFGDEIRRATSAQAQQRNALAAALSQALWVPHAAPGGKAWAAVQSALSQNQPVHTFAEKDNAPLIQAGARPFEELDFYAFTELGQFERSVGK